MESEKKSEQWAGVLIKDRQMYSHKIHESCKLKLGAMLSLYSLTQGASYLQQN